MFALRREYNGTPEVTTCLNNIANDLKNRKVKRVLTTKPKTNEPKKSN